MPLGLHTTVLAPRQNRTFFLHFFYLQFSCDKPLLYRRVDGWAIATLNSWKQSWLKRHLLQACPILTNMLLPWWATLTEAMIRTLDTCWKPCIVGLEKHKQAFWCYTAGLISRSGSDFQKQSNKSWDAVLKAYTCSLRQMLKLCWVDSCPSVRSMQLHTQIWLCCQYTGAICQLHYKGWVVYNFF